MQKYANDFNKMKKLKLCVYFHKFLNINVNLNGKGIDRN